MSKDVQEKSPGDQRKALVQYAKNHKYRIVGEYIDEGISGDATEKRTGFLQMIADCRLKRFETVLCWDQDRFGRFDPLEAGFWIKPMRDAGIVLETLAQGRVDWNDFAGRLIWSVNQEAKHAFLRDLARNSLRGNIERAKAGRFVGRAAFGYVNNNGQLEFGSDANVEAVRRVFELRTKYRYGHRVIGLKMKEEGFAAPNGGLNWSADSVRIILGREIYTGTLIYGRKHRGKYSTMIDGTVAPAKAGQSIINPNPIRIPNTHPAIIDRTTWDIVESMRTDPPKPHATVGNSGAPLSGLLVCGQCGGPMYSQSLQRAAGQKNPNYICSSYMLGKGCGYCFVSQKTIHNLVAAKIREDIVGSSFERLKDRIRKMLNEQSSANAGASEKTRLAKLDRQIDAASQRLLIVNQRLFAQMESKLLEMKEQRDRMAEAIHKTENPRIGTVDEYAQKLWDLSTIFETSEASFVRARLREFITHIRLDFRIGKKTGRGQSYDFLGCEIVVKQPS
jgi:site-specific DNA recombinase